MLHHAGNHCLSVQVAPDRQHSCGICESANVRLEGLGAFLIETSDHPSRANGYSGCSKLDRLETTIQWKTIRRREPTIGTGPESPVASISLCAIRQYDLKETVPFDGHIELLSRLQQLVGNRFEQRPAEVQARSRLTNQRTDRTQYAGRDRARYGKLNEEDTTAWTDVAHLYPYLRLAIHFLVRLCVVS